MPAAAPPAADGQAPQYDYYGNPTTPSYQPGQATPGVRSTNVDPGGYQGGGDWQQAPGKKSHAVLILTIILILVVLGAAGAGVYVYLKAKKGPTEAPVPAVGQCVVPSGSNPTLMKIVACGAGTYVVDQVFTNATDASKCSGVRGATQNYVYSVPSDASKDYVLCLTKQ